MNMTCIIIINHELMNCVTQCMKVEWPCSYLKTMVILQGPTFLHINFNVSKIQILKWKSISIKSLVVGSGKRCKGCHGIF